MIELETASCAEDPLHPAATSTVVEFSRDRRAAHWCGWCDSGDIERSHPHGVIEHAVYYLVNRRRYRCRNCGRKFYDRSSQTPAWRSVIVRFISERNVMTLGHGEIGGARVGRVTSHDVIPP